ncbi:unnamed protein product [Sphenostylis stenocarpa]|uniref:Uncharacterized protein n=1 Tax=Sphenostylis stenocarpa TaxID=92480 RepID=A0AA86W2M4_9FABA|nr:unnamed protein product [Sphenostylis stenocarpa]
MDSVPADVSNSHPVKDPPTSSPAKASDGKASAALVSEQDNSAREAPSVISPTGISSWAKNLKLSQSFSGLQDDSSSGNVGKSTFARLTSNLGLRMSPKSPVADDSSNETAVQSNLFGTITKGLVDTSKNAVKAVQVKARHVVSQNKRRYQKQKWLMHDMSNFILFTLHFQEGGFDLDMTYITENIIAMGFPAGDMSSGFFGYVEGFYRNHMEEVIKFFETHHKMNLEEDGRPVVSWPRPKDKIPQIKRLHDQIKEVEGLDWNSTKLTLISILSFHTGEKILKVGPTPFSPVLLLPNIPFISPVLKLFQRKAGKYKVYNLCSERLYDASLFEGKVASFPFDDHNCPPIQLIISFCQSAYSWLKQDIENVVVVHCKAGMARTGLMISSLLLFLKFFPTAEESMDYYNQKRCIDGKGLVLPSQIRYVKYFERVLTYFNGENPPARRYFTGQDVAVVFTCLNMHTHIMFCTGACLGDSGFTDALTGLGPLWLNTTMTENRKVLNTGDLDGFDKRKLPSPGFMVEVVLVDYNGDVETSQSETTATKSDESSSNSPARPVPVERSTPAQIADKEPESHNNDKDDVFSDGEGEQSASSRTKQTKAPSEAVGKVKNDTRGSDSNRISNQIANLTHATEQVSLGNKSSTSIHHASEPRSNVDGKTVSSIEVPSAESEFKAMAADASVFTFGDDDDYESD